MEIRKSLLVFRTLIQAIKYFKENIIPSPDLLETLDYKGEMKTLATRYLLLTGDKDFQDKIKELYYLETAIMQIRCINDINPVFFSSKPSGNDYVYVRSAFLNKTPVHQMARSMGKTALFKKTARQLSTDPVMIEKAKIRLRQDMEDQLILEEYKYKYNGGRPIT